MHPGYFALGSFICPHDKSIVCLSNKRQTRGLVKYEKTAKQIEARFLELGVKVELGEIDAKLEQLNKYKVVRLKKHAET